ncbi:MAG TPA: ATP-grasp domain-containing protein, partial [Candidatus Hydrogenedentes bacterium]|nr:ATP-grasp domain-containing protein [Candidatus Hydrogenedentota bacterium]
QPLTIALEDAMTADDFWAAVSSSGAVLKRRQGCGGADAQFIRHLEELQPYLESLEKDRWILQEYVEGVDIAVNFVSKSGNFIAWFVQEALSTLGQFGYQMHMRISTEHTEAVAMAQRVVDALEWEGPGCVDFRVDKRTNQLLCFENNPRFGRAVLIGTVAGVNLPLAAAGRPVPDVEAQVAEFQHLSNLYRSPTQLFRPWAQNGIKRRTILPEILRDPIPEMAQSFTRFVSQLSPRGRNAARG